MSQISSPNPSVENRPSTPAPYRGRYNIWNALQTVISVAVIMATFLTLWTPGNLFSNRLFNEMLYSAQNSGKETPMIALPTLTPSPLVRIGIVAGHWGSDSGAVCADGLKEVDVNLRIATLVKQNLVADGYDVDLLQEFDQKLFEYQARALISIHNDSCEYSTDEATGFKVAAAPNNPYPEKAERLTSCMIQRYGSITGLRFHPNTITTDMTSYHAFNEINTSTTAAIIETGFLNLDRQILTEKPELIAEGVTAGILCFIKNEPVNPPSKDTPVP